MSKPGSKENPARFLQSIVEEAGALGFETEPLKENGNSIGLVVFEDGLAMSHVARLIRKTALVLTDKDGGDISPSISADTCQVSVEERAQLFDFFAKGAGKS